MRKVIFESEDEFVEVMNKAIVLDVDNTPDVAESVKAAKKLGLIKQSPFEKLSDAWENFRPQKYYHEDWNGLYVIYNDQWVNAATDVITAQEKVIEYLKQKLEEQK
jgi:hypothetical protein